VIKGVGDGRVLLGDPARGVRVMTRADFELIWKNRLLFVIHNEQSLAIFNSKSDWVAVPRAPLSTGVVRDGLQNITIPRFGVGEL
jgi:predicted double-glycine peptidase